MAQTKRPNYVLWMLCVFMLLSAASYFFRPKEPEISYAEVVQLFVQEKVKSFTVQDTTLTLKLREAVDGRRSSGRSSTTSTFSTTTSTTLSWSRRPLAFWRTITTPPTTHLTTLPLPCPM